MFWNEDTDNESAYEVPDDIVDVNFKIKCPHLPLDHAHQLSSAIIKELPWINDHEFAGIHLIHGAESGNGWIRPTDPTELIYPSRRTLFTIRTPQEFIQEVQNLDGKTIQICDSSIEFYKPSIRKLSKLTTIFARYILADHVEDEEAFLQEMAELLRAKNIHPKKMMSGRATTLTFPNRIFSVRSLMIDGLESTQSVRLQQEGLGAGRKFGCGLFLPHKGIDAVGDAQEK
ncbi:MAG: type I-MYXAN CRISPR-associated protein Cas6/Cmx6 [Pseudomonadota bacterium]